MKRIATLIAAIALLRCESDRLASREHVHAASALTQRYAASPLARWDVHGRAAGADCRILLVETSIVMEDSMVEALHYGAGVYDVYEGGVQQFARDRAFRGVAYRDRSGRIWKFGSINSDEPLAACR